MILLILNLHQYLNIRMYGCLPCTHKKRKRGIGIEKEMGERVRKEKERVGRERKGEIEK